MEKVKKNHLLPTIAQGKFGLGVGIELHICYRYCIFGFGAIQGAIQGGAIQGAVQGAIQGGPVVHFYVPLPHPHPSG